MYIKQEAYISKFYSNYCNANICHIPAVKQTQLFFNSVVITNFPQSLKFNSCNIIGHPVTASNSPIPYYYAATFNKHVSEY